MSIQSNLSTFAYSESEPLIIQSETKKVCKYVEEFFDCESVFV